METSIFDCLHAVGVIPVLEIEAVENALPLAEALQVGGLPVAEITLRTEAALDSIRCIAREMPEVLIGAGTVINQEQAQAAVEAGAKFIVTPGMIEDVVLWTQEYRVPVLAGAVTPTEMIKGMNLGLNVLKFFPSETMGGLKALQSLSDPFPKLRFVPTGGIRLENMAEYLRMPKIHAVGGSWMAKRAMIAERNFDEIKRLAGQASAVVKEIRREETQ
ncbi:MAG: bifunctional 4-hydroxy-2-oxoglutarate aldolase/2-dehydro-3-deoxy-phosphogluconate aldolase [Chloroflexota bacterium]